MVTGMPRGSFDVDVVCIGATMVDMLGVESSSTLAGVETYKRAAGGAQINVAATVARLKRRAALITRVGDDVFGRYLQSEVRRFQILDDGVQVDPSEPTTLAFFARHSTEQDFLVVRGADRQLAFEPPAQALIERAAAVHTSTFSLAVEPIRSAVVRALEIAHGAGRIVSLDPNFRAGSWPDPQTLRPLLRQILPLTTIIKPSLRDAEAIWGAGLTPGDYVERFHAHGARQVLLTLGREGVAVSDGRHFQRLPAVPIDTMHTSGVGDAFSAAALIALIDGHTLVTAARVAMLVAHYKLRSMDHTAPLPAWSVLVEQARAQEQPTAALLTSPRPPRGG